MYNINVKANRKKGYCIPCQLQNACPHIWQKVSAFNMCLVEKLARLASANQVALFETFIFYGISVSSVKKLLNISEGSMT